jgi:hypothetical protein
VKFTARPLGDPVKVTQAATTRYRRQLRRAEIRATHRASKEAQVAVQEKIRSVGLGKLYKAVGQTSTQAQGDNGADPYGVIFAKGGDESSGGGTLESYSRGSVIRPLPGGTWLAIPTAAVPKYISIGGARRRLTPELYLQSGLMSSIGILEFRPLGPDKAIWVIRRVSVSPKTGRAKALGPGRTRTRIVQKEIIAFIGIRVTTRAQRFDHVATVGFYGRRVPQYIEEELAQMRGDGA